jgi:hypothetical protein
LAAKICPILKKIISFENGKSKIGFGEIICSVTEGARSSRRKAHCNLI